MNGPYEMPVPGKYLGRYVFRGAFATSSTAINGDRHRIPIFDGRYDTGFVVREFAVWGLDTECHGTLRTEGYPLGAVSTDRNVTAMMNADNNVQFAWASSPSSGVGPISNSVIDPSYVVIEDLYVFGYATGQSQPWNWMVIADKYELKEGLGPLNMVHNRSQGQQVRTDPGWEE